MVYVICAAAGLAGALAGFFIFAMISSRRKQKACKGEQNPPQRRRKLEFTKLLVFLVLTTYFVGVFIGAKIVFIDYSQLGVFLAFIGTPTATAICFYAWKAKAENILKLKKDNPAETDGIAVDLNNIQS